VPTASIYVGTVESYEDVDENEHITNDDVTE
jgi:hypothetical protein